VGRRHQRYYADTDTDSQPGAKARRRRDRDWHLVYSRSRGRGWPAAFRRLRFPRAWPCRGKRPVCSVGRDREQSFTQPTANRETSGARRERRPRRCEQASRPAAPGPRRPAAQQDVCCDGPRCVGRAKSGRLHEGPAAAARERRELLREACKAPRPLAPVSARPERQRIACVLERSSPPRHRASSPPATRLVQSLRHPSLLIRCIHPIGQPRGTPKCAAVLCMAAALQPAHSTPFAQETTHLIHGCDAPVSAPPSQHCAPALCRSKATISTDVTVGKGRQARCGVVPVARAPVKIRLVMASSILHAGRRPQACHAAHASAWRVQQLTCLPRPLNENFCIRAAQWPETDKSLVLRTDCANNVPFLYPSADPQRHFTSPDPGTPSRTRTTSQDSMHANGKPLIAGNWPPLPRRSYSLGTTCLVGYRAACIPRSTINITKHPFRSSSHITRPQSKLPAREQ
jgi:hypothetical protein